MPSIKRKICPTHGIYSTVSCETCKKERNEIYNNSRDKEAESFYHTQQWRKLRARQLTKEPLCINFDKCGNVATIADHIQEVKDGGLKFDIENLNSICASCHNEKTQREKKKRASRFDR